MSGKKLRTATGDLEQLLYNVRTLVENSVEHYDLRRSCVSCRYFDDINEVCTFNKCNIRPPARIIVDGCDSYEDETEIPF